MVYRPVLTGLFSLLTFFFSKEGTSQTLFYSCAIPLQAACLAQLPNPDGHPGQSPHLLRNSRIATLSSLLSPSFKIKHEHSVNSEGIPMSFLVTHKYDACMMTTEY